MDIDVIRAMAAMLDWEAACTTCGWHGRVPNPVLDEKKTTVNIYALRNLCVECDRRTLRYRHHVP